MNTSKILYIILVVLFLETASLMAKEVYKTNLSHGRINSVSNMLPSSLTEKVLFNMDFDSTLSIDKAKKLLNNKNVSLVKGFGVNGSNCINVNYVGYARGSKRTTSKFLLKRKTKAASLSYIVKFSKNFQWVLGGKLHGLGPENPVAGGKKRKPNKWSARISFVKKGKISTYIYDQDPHLKYGKSTKSEKIILKKDVWHKIELLIKLNDLNKSNGYAKLYVDNVIVVNNVHLKYRAIDTKDTLIQQFLFSTFHGGHKPKYAPKDNNGNYVVVNALFDNFIVKDIQ